MTYCEPEFVEIGDENGFRHIDPVYFIIGKDSEMYIDVPEFMLTEPRCIYPKHVDYWIEKKAAQDGEEPDKDDFPDNIRFFYSLDKSLTVGASYLEISGQSWDEPERLVGTNVTLHF